VFPHIYITAQRDADHDATVLHRVELQTKRRWYGCFELTQKAYLNSPWGTYLPWERSGVRTAR
jgi:hypothetical protein